MNHFLSIVLPRFAPRKNKHKNTNHEAKRLEPPGEECSNVTAQGESRPYAHKRTAIIAAHTCFMFLIFLILKDAAGERRAEPEDNTNVCHDT
jgi:hypothetical protein